MEGQSGQSRVIWPGALSTCYWPGWAWEQAKGQTQVLEAEPSTASAADREARGQTETLQGLVER